MIGSPRVHHRVTDSTNERARELAGAGAPHGTLVTASAQTAGRGRHGRSWVAQAGEALLMTVLLRGLEPRHALLPMMAAVAVCDAVEEVAAVRCEIKWPNDVWVGARKLSGILVEARPAADWAVVGIGVNVAVRAFPPELQETATSLALAHPDELLDELLPALDRWTSAEAPIVLGAWRRRDALAGVRVRWQDGEGVARGIDEDGGLVVELDGGERVVLGAGEVERVRPA